ncbi:hypothetical protein M378DRAFT_183299 [Amanita muscaria Koide BX008]|uniref:LIM zinc-binding domain-containing protein n=1 Tax=Amanita muscaria (strain Koide BX008) TaxID=946122 RepID=A0A0C2XNG0_AMAMK|nr:hypothetical protein M378DRAFT_183299 [Amanita muscaria Koide BX008]
MGFCRRCGDIVAGERCKCGGTAVAPVVSWKEHDAGNQDKWSKTYVLRDRSTSSAGTSASSANRYSRSIPASASIDLSARISAHIAATTLSNSRSELPLRPSQTGPKPEAGVLPSPCDSTLAKVYGSVLQPAESLATFSCVICNTVFPPDATIYPDPQSLDAASENRFLCRPCFVNNGGSKGTCPSCSRPVLMLKSEGGFINAADKFWHKRCFNCDGCQKNIGEAPMVDLLGRPSCPDCFDTCLRRDRQRGQEPSTPTKKTQHSIPIGRRNLGGIDTTSPSVTPELGLRGLEASPSLEELEQRLGIVRNTREGSPSLEELSQRLDAIGKESSRARRDSKHSERYKSPEPEKPSNSLERTDVSRFPSEPSTPVRRQVNSTSRGGSPAPTPDAIEEMKSRFIRSTTNSSPSLTTSPLNHLAQSFTTTSPLKLSRSPTVDRTSIGSRLPIPIVSSQTQPIANVGLESSNSSDASFSPSILKTPDLIPDLANITADSPPSSTGWQESKLPVNRDYEDYRGQNSIGVIIEETDSQLTTPVHTPSKKPDRIASSPSRIPVATRSPKAKVATETIDPSSMVKSNELAASTRCAKCDKLLFSVKGGGKYLTFPAEEGVESKHYHVECFRCSICEGVIKAGGKGQASYVKAKGGPCHAQCAPPQKYAIRKSSSTSGLHLGNSPRNTAGGSMANALNSGDRTPAFNGSRASVYSSSRYEPQFTTSTPSTALSGSGIARFGNRTACPGCNTSVSPMERGVVPGPQGTRWHATCLVCGGKKKKDQNSALWMIGRGTGASPDERRKKGEAGCGKKLDSAAKTDSEGGVWCRECLLLLAPPSSPTKSLIPSATGTTTKGVGVTAQHTGTTLARQFTGMGGVGDSGKESRLLRQLTGGGLSPTRSISPTKQLGGGSFSGTAVSGRPRPKSVIGMRSTKSIDEGRGMFLVRQMTGNGSGNF